jgi:serine/threonine protein phosphatase PrpC
MAEDPGGGARAVVMGMTDVGRVREHNEDCFLVVNRADGRRCENGKRFDAPLDGALLLVVCDGMGGAAAGEVASRMACDRMAAEFGKADFTNSSPDQVTALMDHAVQLANSDIHAAAKADTAQKGMGTTMTAAVVTPGSLFVSQVGDSRAYLLRKGNLNQITKDQSLIGQLIEEGTLTEEEAEKLGGRNIVLQAVGVEESLRVDTKYWPLLRGDVLLLCSDGLSGMVKDAQMKEILLAAGDDVGKAAENLIAEANKNGGRDNVTAIVSRFDGEGLRAPMEAAGDGAVEKAGVAFKAPPPPDVPNPMRRMGFVGLALLVLIGALFLALRKTTADVQIAAQPDDAAVEIVLTTADGKTQYKAVSKNGLATIEGVRPSEQDFDLVATAPGCFPDSKKVGIHEAGQVKLEAFPVPMPGKEVAITSKKTVRVSVRLVVQSRHPKIEPYDKPFDLPETGVARTLSNVPAGDVEITATREGFREFKQTLKLAPQGELKIEVPELVEMKGALVVSCAVDGAHVEAFDDRGESLDKDDVKDGTAKLKIRVGRQSLRVTKFGYKPFDGDVEVADGRETKIAVKLDEELLQVTLSGPPNSEFRIWRATNDGPVATTDADQSAAGQSRAQNLKPGNYEIRWRVGTQDEPPIKFDVHVGDKPRTITLALTKR